MFKTRHSFKGELFSTNPNQLKNINQIVYNI